MMGWQVYPEGLYRILVRFARYRLPVFVTENGICSEDDSERVRFIHSHLGAVKRARAEGVPVSGYFYWSLLDNFEWDKGFRPRFGIIEVDFKNFARKMRPSAQELSASCRHIVSKR